MFIPVGTKPAESLYPQGSAISANDWAILADFWYPIAFATDVDLEPVRARLLDVDLVLYRGADSTVTAALDACPHRQVRLSIGKVVNGEIECPFHGLRFDQKGQCTHVPALGCRTNLPPSYRVRTFEVRERYGLVWTCLGNVSKQDIPVFPGIAQADPKALDYTSVEIWPVSAARQIENFFDLAHLPYVHQATLGGDQAKPLKPGRIEQHPDGVTLRADYVETTHGARACTYTYRIVLPFTVEFKVDVDDDPDFFMESCDIPCPISAHQCKVFQILLYKGSAEERQGMINALAMVNGEDIAVLSAMTLADLPLEQRHEIHLPVDNISNAYRGRLRELGLGK